MMRPTYMHRLGARCFFAGRFIDDVMLFCFSFQTTMLKVLFSSYHSCQRYASYDGMSVLS